MALDLTNYLKFVGALLLVLAMIGGLALLARRFGLGGAIRPIRGRRRLELIEVVALDPKRRLVLVRCDQTQHLLLLGGTPDLVIESNIPVLPVAAAASPLSISSGAERS